MTSVSCTYGLPRCRQDHSWLLILVAVIGFLTIVTQVQAVPSFAEQTGQPCAACHVGAFGPQLTPYGRDFKLNGYVASDGQPHFPPVAATVQTSFTQTATNQPKARWFGENSNAALDQISLYYAGRVTSTIGTFFQVTYDGVARQVSLDNVDIRHTNEVEFLWADASLGITINNNPTVQDLWNSTPVWSFPYNSSALAHTPAASALIEGGLAQRVAGTGVYMLWNDLVYAEIDAYRGLGGDVRDATGIVPISGSDTTRGLIPYWRLALQRQIGQHYLEFGTYGLSASVFPGNDRSAGRPNRLTDWAFDANWQWFQNSTSVVGDVISAHATYINEYAALGASKVLIDSNNSDRFHALRANVSYSVAATVTPTIAYFRTQGTPDPSYWATTSGRPNSEGYIAEIAYVPFGKPDSPLKWLNLRLAVQYVGYTRFDGASHGASDNNTVYSSLWGAVRF